MADGPHTLTWKQRRELELELWLEDHLRALAEVRPDDLDAPGGPAAVATRARELAHVADRLHRLRGEHAADERALAALRSELDGLP